MDIILQICCSESYLGVLTPLEHTITCDLKPGREAVKLFMLSHGDSLWPHYWEDNPISLAS